jgi:hypothetical protein
MKLFNLSILFGAIIFAFGSFAMEEEFFSSYTSPDSDYTSSDSDCTSSDNEVLLCPSCGSPDCPALRNDEAPNEALLFLLATDLLPEELIKEIVFDSIKDELNSLDFNSHEYQELVKSLEQNNCGCGNCLILKKIIYNIKLNNREKASISDLIGGKKVMHDFELTKQRFEDNDK